MLCQEAFGDLTKLPAPPRCALAALNRAFTSSAPMLTRSEILPLQEARGNGGQAKRQHHHLADRHCVTSRLCTEYNDLIDDNFACTCDKRGLSSEAFQQT